MLGSAESAPPPVDLGIAKDEPESLRAKLAEGLRDDVLLISGGVSAGKLDLVPGLLRELGVVEVFHKIRLKPGKPLWFGTARWSPAGRDANAWCSACPAIRSAAWSAPPCLCGRHWSGLPDASLGR